MINVTKLVVTCMLIYQALISMVVLAQPKSAQAVATPGKSGALQLTYYLTAAADLHYAVQPAGRRELEANEIKAAAATTSTDDNNIMAGTLSRSAAEKLNFMVSGLDAGVPYDIYFVAESTGSNGVFGKVASALSVKTNSVPATVSKVKAVPLVKSTTTIALEYEVDKPGIIHYAACPLSFDLSVFPTVLSEWQGQLQALCVIGSSDTDDSDDDEQPTTTQEKKQKSLHITELTDATSYKVLVVAEAPETGGLLGSVVAVRDVVSTFGFPPTAQEFTAVAKDASESEIEVKFNTIECDEECERNVLMHIVVIEEEAEKEKLPVPAFEEDEFHHQTHHTPSSVDTSQDLSTAEGIKSYIAENPHKSENIKTIRLSELKTKNLFTATRLDADKSYRVSMTLETAESEGIMGDAYVASVKTHALPPSIDNAVLSAIRGSCDQLNLAVNTSEEVIMHLVLIDSEQNEIPRTFEEFFKLPGVIQRTEKEFDIDFADLKAETDYVTYLLLETLNSNGLYSKVYSSRDYGSLKTLTNVDAPEISQVAISAVDATSDSVLVSLNLTHSSLHTVSVFYTLSSEDDDSTVLEQQKQLHECSLRNEMKCEFQIQNLTAATIYDVELYTETAEGVQGPVKALSKAAVPHALAPTIETYQAIAVDASDSSVQIDVVLSNSGVVHSAIFPQNNDRLPHNLLENILKCATSENEKCEGSSDFNYRRNNVSGSATHQSLLPNTSYDVVILTETLNSHGVFGYYIGNETLSSVVPSSESSPSFKEDFVLKNSHLAVTTHATAPKIVKVSAVPANGSVSELDIFFELETCGLMHYSLSNIDLKDPAQIANAEVMLHPAQERYGIVSVENFNGTCTGNVSVSGLDSDATYHVTAVSETFNSNGVVSKTMYPPEGVSLVVSTHHHPPSFTSLEITPVELKSDEIEISLRLDHYGLVHYLVLLRQYNESVIDPASSQYNWTETQRVSSILRNDLNASALKIASCDRADFLGDGVAGNGTIDVPRADVEKGKWAEKKINKLLPGAQYDICVATETADSNGLYGDIQCTLVSTFADYGLIQESSDASSAYAIESCTDKIRVEYSLPKLLKPIATTDSASSVTGRQVHYVVSQDRYSAPSAENLVSSTVGERSVTGKGILTDVVSQNETHITVGTTVNSLDANQEYSVHFASQAVVNSKLRNGKVAHVFQNLSHTVSTFASPPKISDYKITPTKGNTTNLTMEIQLQDGSRNTQKRGWIYAILTTPACSSDLNALVSLVALPSSTSSNITTIDDIQQEMPCVSAMYKLKHNSSSHERRESWVLSSSSVSAVVNQTHDVEWNVGTVNANTTYEAYVATESLGSRGVVGKVLAPVTVRTHVAAPEFDFLYVAPRRASTSELNVTYQLSRPGHVHVVVAPAGAINASCSQPHHVSQSSRYYSSQNKDDNCSDIKTTYHRKIDITDATASTLMMENLDHLDPNTTYDVLVVTESWKSDGVVSDVKEFRNLTTFAPPPLLKSHGFFPTPGKAFEITVQYKMYTEGMLHFLVEEESARSSSEDPTGFLGHAIVAQHSVLITEAEQELTHEMSVPHSNTTYTVHLVTETTGSGGVYGKVANQRGIRTHAEAPEMDSVSLRATDGKMDTLTLSACAATPFTLFYFLSSASAPSLNTETARQSVLALYEEASEVSPVQNNESYLTMGNATVVTRPQNTNEEKLYCGKWEITDLSPSTSYQLQYLTESLESYGVISSVSLPPLKASTHGNAPRLLEEVDCSAAPDCTSLGREECWLHDNTCGECLEGLTGKAGADNSPCVQQAASTTEVSEEVSESTERASTETIQEENSITEETATTTSVSSNETTSVEAPEQYNSCPANSSPTGEGQCSCNSGFVINPEGTACVMVNSHVAEEAPPECPAHSSPSGPGQCACNAGFELNAIQTACVRSITRTTAASTYGVKL